MSYFEEADDENKCEGCGRMEDYLNDNSLCEDCEREAGIDRKESERDAYEDAPDDIDSDIFGTAEDERGAQMDKDFIAYAKKQGYPKKEPVEEEDLTIGEPDLMSEDEDKLLSYFSNLEADEDLSVSGPPAGDTIPANQLYVDDEDELPTGEANKDGIPYSALEFEPERQGRRVKINSGAYAGQTGTVGAIPLIDDSSFFVRVDGVHNEYEDGEEINVADVTFLGGEEFKEEEHPRDEGKFTSKGGGDSGKYESAP